MSNQSRSIHDQAVLARATAEIVGLAAMDLIETMRPSLIQPDRAQAALYLNIAESLSAYNCLVRAGLETHGALHVRSMLESLVNMILLKNPNHLKQMHYDKIEGEFKVFNELIEDPYLSQESVFYIKENIGRLTPEREALRLEGFRKKVVSKSIKEANLSFLAPAYVMLNSIAHWDLAVLTERYEKQGGGFKVFSETPSSVTFGVIFLAIQIMVIATDALKEIALFSEGSYEREFKKMNNAWGILLQIQEKTSGD